jgi:hypothetical protein
VELYCRLLPIRNIRFLNPSAGPRMRWHPVPKTRRSRSVSSCWTNDIALCRLRKEVEADSYGSAMILETSQDLATVWQPPEVCSIRFDGTQRTAAFERRNDPEGASNIAVGDLARGLRFRTADRSALIRTTVVRAGDEFCNPIQIEGLPDRRSAGVDEQVRISSQAFASARSLLSQMDPSPRSR